jgi:hypothetical protein
MDMRRYVGIRALKSISAQFVEGGLNRDLASGRQRVYIHLMTRANDETTSERAERLLADRTRFQLSSDAWGGLVAIMDREAQPNPKLAMLLSDRPGCVVFRAAGLSRPARDGGLHKGSFAPRSGLA